MDSESIGYQALIAFNQATEAQKDVREQCRADRRFCNIPGAQWEGQLGDFFANRPMVEINKVNISVRKIKSEYRRNRVTVDFVSKDGSPSDQLSELCDDLFRADSDDSNAMDAFDNAFDEAVTGGIGAWRLTTVYEDEGDEENEQQNVCIEPIYDADVSVYFDANSKKQDKSDSKRAWLVYEMSPAAFAEEYPDESPADWPQPTEGGGDVFDWYTPDVVRLCEYYRVIDSTKRIHIYENVIGEEERFSDEHLEDPEFVAELAAKGTKHVRTRKVKTQRVRKYIMSGGGVLEDLGEIAGSCIPIVPVYGQRFFIDGKEWANGQIRWAKDPQRIINIETSRLAEISAHPSTTVPIFTGEQIAGHEQHWAEANQTNEPFRLVNPVVGPDGQEAHMGPVGYTQPPEVPPALAALIQVANTDMQEVLGGQQEGEKLHSNVSADAVELVQARIDVQSELYMDNMRKAMKRCGEIWLGMAKEIYVEPGRRLRVLGRDGDVASQVIGEAVMDENGRTVDGSDLTRANFSVKSEVGPASESKRGAIVKAMAGMLNVTTDPVDQKILSSIAMMNMDGEGLSDIREFKRKELVQMGVLQPTKRDMQEQAAQQEQQQPDPNAIFLQSEAEKNAALAQKAQADTAKSLADTEKSKAQTAEILAGIPRDNRTAAVDDATKIGQAIGQNNGFPKRPFF